VAITHDTAAAPRPADPVGDVEAPRRPGTIERLRAVWEYRELLGNLVRKELKVKYKNSALGFLWSLLNPMLYLVVFYVVFSVFLKTAIPNFPIFLLCGLLPYNLFSASLGGGTSAIVGNAGLVGKVWFPREILPLAAIGAALVHFALQLAVLAGALVVFWYEPSWSYLPLIVPALVVLLLLGAALGIALAAINVYARDTQHLLELVMLAWFWMTPIVYPYSQVSTTSVHGFTIGNWALLNPLTPIVITMQRAIWGNHMLDIATKAGGTQSLYALPAESQWWYLGMLGIVALVAVVLIFVAFAIFGRLEDDFAENI
jgi:ABC-2 type transport system permease protein